MSDPVPASGSATEPAADPGFDPEHVSTARWRAPHGVVDRLVGTDAVLARPRERASIALNRTAYALWLTMADPDGTTLNTAVDALADAFGQAPAAIRDDAARMVADLARTGWLVAVVDEPGQVDDAVEATGCADDDPRGAAPLAHADHWHLPVAPSPCQAGVDARPWIRTVAVRVGRFHVGIRVDVEATGVIVERLLEAHVVDDPDVPAAWSLVLGPPGPDFPRRGLYEGRTFLTGSEEPGPIMDTLLARLAGLLPVGPGRIRLAAGAAAVPGLTSTGLTSTDLTSTDLTSTDLTSTDHAMVELRPQARGTTMPGTAPAPAVIDVEAPGGRPRLVAGWPGLDLDRSVLARLGATPPVAAPIAGIVNVSDLPEGAARVAALVRLLHLAPDDDPVATFELAVHLGGPS